MGKLFSKNGKSDKTKGNLPIVIAVVFGIAMMIIVFTGGDISKIKGFGHMFGNTDTVPAGSSSFDSSVTLSSAELIRVVDGDTLLVNFNNMETYVLLLGVDTAESVNPDASKNNEYGKMASKFTEETLNGISTVYLEFGDSLNDKYGRVLAYVWLDGDVVSADEVSMKKSMLNYMLVDKGYAYDMPVAPNLKYSEFFKQACEDSKKTSTGLWSYKEFRNLYSKK